MQGLILHSWEVVPDEFRVGDKVKVISKTIGDSLTRALTYMGPSEFHKIDDIRLPGRRNYLPDYVADTGHEGEPIYDVSGAFFLACDLELVRSKESSLKLSWDVVDMGEGKRIKIAYSLITPESALTGDFEDTGWLDEKGVEMSDLEDWEEGATPVDKAVGYLGDEGVQCVSSFPFAVGDWYIRDEAQDNGKVMEYTYHLSGFTPEEEQEIYKQLF